MCFQNKARLEWRLKPWFLLLYQGTAVKQWNELSSTNHRCFSSNFVWYCDRWEKVFGFNKCNRVSWNEEPNEFNQMLDSVSAVAQLVD